MRQAERWIGAVFQGVVSRGSPIGANLSNHQ
jgi:hypothetical protein